MDRTTVEEQLDETDFEQIVVEQASQYGGRVKVAFWTDPLESESDA